MSAKPLMFVGVIYPLNKMDAPMPVSFVGNEWDPSLSVGGGPLPGGPGQPPLGIWGPTDPRPTHPIAPGGPPPGIWPGPGVPTHPIAPGGPPPKPTFPIWGPPGTEFPPGSGYPPVAGHPLPPGGEVPKPIIGWEAQIIWSAETGWAVIIVPKDETLVPTPSK